MWWNSNTQIAIKLKKTEIVMKLKTKFGTKMKKLKSWWNSKTHIVKIKLITQMGQNKKKSNCDKIKKTQIVTTLKNSNCDISLIVIKLKLWPNLNCDKTQIVTKVKLWH